MRRNEWQKRELNVHHVTKRRKLDDLECEFSKPGIVPASVALIRERVRERKPCNNSRRHDTTLYITVNVLLCVWVEPISGVQVKD